MFFSSNRPPALPNAAQIWVAFREDPDDDFGWEPAVNLGPDISPLDLDDNAPTFFRDRQTGMTGANINTPDDDGGPALSCDGTTLYFYAIALAASKDATST